MNKIRKAISIRDAVQKLVSLCKIGETECVSITECEGRYLAEDIVATADLPSFTRSAYDGYAVRTADTVQATSENPLEFEVVEHVGAGAVPSKIVKRNQTVRIMTGAQMPQECDGVIGIELVENHDIEGKSFARMKRPVMSGDHISMRGEEAQNGDVLLSKGSRLHAGEIAILATFGYSEVPVVKRPRVGIIATGSELLDVEEPEQDGKIRNSNTHMISSQITRVGGEPVYYGKLPDDLEVSYHQINSLLDVVDFLITTGGVSVGDFDFMPEVYKKIGADVLFDKVAMRPGSVTTVARKGEKFLFGLSGNPSACFVGFELFVRPVLKMHLASEKPHLKKISAVLSHDVGKPNPFTRLVRSRVFFQETKVCVEFVGIDKSNILTSIALANALCILPEGTRGYQNQDQVEVLLLDDDEGCEWPWAIQSYK